MKILLSKKEQKVFDAVCDELDILEALNIVARFSMLTEAIDIDPEQISEDPETEDEDELEEDSGRLPGVKPETGIMNPVPQYDTKLVMESRISGYT